MNTGRKCTFFYFNKVDQLIKLDNFEVEAMYGSDAPIDKKEASPEYWTIFGYTKAENGTTPMALPVADFPTEIAAKLFKEMCIRLNHCAELA